jgi:hypothetical protein
MHFSWLMSDSDPEWATLQVFDALASLPFLNDLHLCCWSFSNPFLQPRRLPHLENLTFTRESWQDDDDIAPIPIARLINWSQPKLTTLIIADNGYHNEFVILAHYPCLVLLLMFGLVAWFSYFGYIRTHSRLNSYHHLPLRTLPSCTLISPQTSRIIYAVKFCWSTL